MPSCSLGVHASESDYFIGFFSRYRHRCLFVFIPQFQKSVLFSRTWSDSGQFLDKQTKSILVARMQFQFGFDERDQVLGSNGMVFQMRNNVLLSEKQVSGNV